jgi:hypothetical protein
MSKIGPRFKYLEQPIFCLCVLKDYVLVASGGGGKKFGVRNKIVSYKITNNKFSDEICHSAEFDKEIPVFISSYEDLNLFCTCIDNMTVFYTLDVTSGEFAEACRVKVMDFFDADIYQSVSRLDNKGTYFASGGTDGMLK